MEEESRDHLSFLTTCRAARQACHPEAHVVLMCPCQLLMGNMSLATVLAIPPQASTAREESTPVISCQTTPAVPRPSSGIKQQHHSPIWEVSSPPPGDKVVGASEEPPHQKQKDGTPHKKS